MALVKCPNNPNHKRFITSAHVVQDWYVDENGEFLDVHTECSEIAHKPDLGNSWVCAECGTEAEKLEP